LAGTTGAATTPGRLTVAVLTLLTVLLPLAARAAGDPVPLPHLRPDHFVSPLRATTAAIAPDPGAPIYSPNSRFTRDEQIALARINAYFNSFSTMEGQFIQFGPTGDQSEGVFFMSRPGKIRFHYSAPSRLDVIADGSTVAIEDGRANTQQLYPLSKTPLRYLLTDRIDLTSDQLVDSVREEPDLISVLIVEKSALIEGKLALIFDRKTYELRQWIVTDAQGLNTSVAIYNVTTGKTPDPGLFRIQVKTSQNR
jgi:outer membrane lipoprotein-sorting protein